MRTGFPAVEALIPHFGPMRLLDRVLFHDERETRCAADAGRAGLFRDAKGEIPGWVALELMAQCAAVHGSLAARGRGGAPRSGLFLGARRARFAAGRLEPGRPLVVRVRHVRGESELVAFDGDVTADGGEELARARLAFRLAAAE